VDKLLENSFRPLSIPSIQKVGGGHFEIDTVWGKLPFLPPKLIVGLSLTELKTERKKYPRNAVILPAIVDTGYTDVLEIDERHLYEPIYSKEYIEQIKEDVGVETRQSGTGHKIKHFLMPVQIWLHRHAYSDFRKRPVIDPFPLKETEQMRVIVHDDPKAPYWPPLPLIGLQALRLNSLTLNVRPCNHTFSLIQDEC
jgi:hypothetical protein